MVEGWCMWSDGWTLLIVVIFRMNHFLFILMQYWMIVVVNSRYLNQSYIFSSPIHPHSFLSYITSAPNIHTHHHQPIIKTNIFSIHIFIFISNCHLFHYFFILGWVIVFGRLFASAVNSYKNINERNYSASVSNPSKLRHRSQNWR